MSEDRPYKGSSGKTDYPAPDLAAALKAELAAKRSTRTPSWCLHGDTYRHCPTTPTHPNAE